MKDNPTHRNLVQKGTKEMKHNRKTNRQTMKLIWMLLLPNQPKSILINAANTAFYAESDFDGFSGPKRPYSVILFICIICYSLFYPPRRPPSAPTAAPIVIYYNISLFYLLLVLLLFAFFFVFRVVRLFLTVGSSL